MLGTARAAGIRTLDTARAYGESEAVIGALAGDDPWWSVITKIDPSLWRESEGATAGVAAAAESLRSSRQALRRTRLDGVLVHDDAHRTAAAGAIWDYLRSERARGEVGLIGTSVGSPAQAFDALADPSVDIIQVASSLLDQRLLRADFFPQAAAAGKRIFVRSVFMQGLAHLDPRHLPTHLMELREPLEMVAKWAQRRGWPTARAFLAFPSRFEGATVLWGCESKAQLEADLGWLTDVSASDEELAELGDLIPVLPERVLNPALWVRQGSSRISGSDG